jgi:hypothetical protein
MSKKKSAKTKRTPRAPAHKGPWVLIFDIETAPILGHVWSLWQQNVGLNQIEKDWHILSWSAKWLHDPAEKVIYRDQRNAADIEDDKALLTGLWKLLDKADVVITQNGRSFDQKKVQARFVMNGMQPPSSYKHIDTKLLAKKHFAFTSNKLEYMTDKLNKKYKKLKHTKFPGHELWTECMAGNIEAWDEMRKYNTQDVLALEELYHTLIPWDDSINFSLWNEEEEHVCTCGSTDFHKRGFYYTSAGKWQKWRCKECGAETRDKFNLLPASKRKKLHVGTPR